MYDSLVKLKTLVFSSNHEDIPGTIDLCLYGILDVYDHLQMTILTRLLEMLLDTDLADEASRTLKIIDLVKFPVKKTME